METNNLLAVLSSRFLQSSFWVGTAHPSCSKAGAANPGAPWPAHYPGGPSATKPLEMSPPGHNPECPGKGHTWQDTASAVLAAHWEGFYLKLSFYLEGSAFPSPVPVA